MHRTLRIAAAIGLLLVAFGIDVSTGNEVSSSLFYIVPVAFTAWFIGRIPALTLAFGAACLWLVAQDMVGGGFSSANILYWNVTAETTIYLIVAMVVARARADRAREEALIAQVTVAKDRLDRELNAVGMLQHDLLPQTLPALDGYAWDSYYVTSARAGGDYYDAIPLDDGRLAIMVADATGHGAPAAVLMAMAKALLRGESEPLVRPDATLASMNRKLAAMLPPGWFLTACFAILDPCSGRLEYSLAGHEPPILVRGRHGDAEQLPVRGGPPLGPFPDVHFQAGHTQLGPGDTIVFFTDGVTEAMNAEHEMLGVTRLRESLSATTELSLEAVKAGLVATMAAHTDGAPFADDTTILMLRRLHVAAQVA